MQRLLLLFFFIFCFGNFKSISQTIINRGDLAILAVNANLGTANNGDEISFVCFKDITNGTEIQILDAAYERCITGFWCGGGEGGAILKRTGGTIPAGTVITFRTAQNITTSATSIAFTNPDASWTVTDLFTNVRATNLNLNNGGDQIYIAQGGTWTEQTGASCASTQNANYPGNAGRVLFGFSTSGSWVSLANTSQKSGLYPGMTCFTMSPTGSTDFNKYTGPLTPATQTAWITRISDPLNWDSYSTTAQYNSTGYNYNVPNYTIPIIAGSGIPTATWTIPSALCSNAAAIDLNTYVTGITGGTWSGTGVTGNTFNPTGLSGSYNITYSVNYVSGGNSCPITQTNAITVSAASTAPTVTAKINYCQNATATALTATGSNLLWYTVANGGTASTTAPTPLTTTVGTTPYYVSQNIGCEGPRALITVTVSAAPTINTVPNQTVCRNSATAAINFSGTGTAIYNWTNNTPSIGLVASGTGNIPSFLALNTGTTPVTATITATPVSTGFAYVPNYGIYPFPAGNTVSVINTTTNTVVNTVTVGDNPFGVAVSPDGTKVYVTNYGTNSVSVISTATNTVIATIAVGNQPMGIAVTPDGTKVYVVNQNLLGNPGNVSVIDAGTNTVVATVPVYLRPLAIAISPDGTKAYVASVNSNNISVINTATNIVSTVIAVGVQPTAVAISPDGSRLYVANFANNNVSVINTSTNAVITTITLGSGPNGTTVSPDGTKLYVTNQTSNNVSIINTSSNTVTATVPVGIGPHGISFTSDGTKAYIANAGTLLFPGNTVSVINTATNTVANTVSVGLTPHSLGNFITPSSGCSGTPTTFTITVNPPPTATYNYSSTTFCATGTASPIITGTTGGVFSGSGMGLVINNVTGVIDLAASLPGSYTPKYNITVGGCNVTYTTNVTINALPAVPVVSVTQPTCIDPTGTLTATSPLGTNYTYSIDGGANFRMSPIFSSINPGTGYVLVKDATTGCINTSILISVNAPPASPASPVTIVVQPTCTSPTGSITITSPTGAGLTYSIDGTNFQAGTTFTNLSPNIYTVTVKNAGGCSTSSSNITINSAASFPAPTFTVTQPTCTIATGSITVASPLGATYTYSIDGTNFQASTSFTNLAANNYTVTVKDAGGCSNAGSVTLNAVSAVATPVTTIVQPTCTVSTGSVTVSSPTGIGFTYSIDGTNFQSSNTFNNLAPNTYTLTVKNASVCTSTASFTIFPSTGTPTGPTVTLPVAYCQNATATALSATGTNLLWYTSASGGTGSSTAPTPSTSAIGTTNYYVSQTTSCESQRAMITVKVNSLPTINAVANQAVCNGSNTAAINFSGTGTAIYNWTNSNPSIGLPASGTGNISSFAALNSGTTPVTATITATPVSVGYAYVGNFALAPNSAVSYVSIINTSTDAVIGNVNVGVRPSGVSVSPDGSKVYVANSNSSVSVINTATNTVTATIFVGVPPIQPSGIVVSPDGSKVYVAAVPGTSSSTIPSTLFVIDVLTNTVTASVTLGLASQSVCVSPDGSKVYVSNSFSNDISVIDAATNTAITVIPVGSQPQIISISPDGTKLYVPNTSSNNISIINTATNSVMATVPGGTTPTCSAVSPDGTKLYIANQNINSLSVINTATNAITATIAVGSIPRGISCTSDGTKVYVVNSFSNNVSVINTSTNTVMSTVPVGTGPSCYGNFITPNSGCAGAPTTFTITVNPTPQVPIPRTVQPTCTVSTGSITVSSPTGTGFTYSIDGTNFQSTNTFNNLAPNTYTVTVKNASGCINTNTANITAASTLPVPTYTATQPTCTVPTGSITVLSPIGNTFLYSIDGSTFQFSDQFTNLVPATYTVTVRNGAGCTNSVIVIINPPATAPAAPTVTTPITYCQNAVATAISANGNNLLWYTTNTGGTGNSIAPTPSTTTVGTTNYYVSQTITGCESPRAMITVDIIAAPATPTIFANGPTSFCENGGVTLTSSTATNIQWYRDGTLLNGSTNVNYTTSIAGIYTVSTSNANNCTATSLGTTVTVNPNPIVYAGLDVLVNGSDSAKLLATASQGNTFTYLWTPATYLNDATILQPWVIKPTTDTYYKLTVTNENNCTGTSQVLVKVLKDIIVPNAFSPNGDNVNDKWEITGLDSYTFGTVEIFARSGQLVYNTIGYSKPWDGNYNGKPLPVGVYYYIINLKNGKPLKSGTITLLR